MAGGPEGPRDALWDALLALLPPTKEELKLDLGEEVDRGTVLLLQQAAELFLGGRRGECLQASEAVLDHAWEKLNAGPWQDVGKAWRQVYAFGCLLKTLCLCQPPREATAVSAALRVCDMGLLMGAAILGDILIRVAAILQAHLVSGKRPDCSPRQELPSTKKARCDHDAAPDVQLERAVPRLRCPSLQHFQKHFLVPGRPVVLEGVADHWPCMKKWSVDYVREVAGCRTVPVEVGSRYTDEDWSQTLMTVSEFISKYIESEVCSWAGAGRGAWGLSAANEVTGPHLRSLFFSTVQWFLVCSWDFTTPLLSNSVTGRPPKDAPPKPGM